MLKMFRDKNSRDLILAASVLVLAIVLLLTAGSRIFGRSTTIVSADIDRIMGEHPAFKEAMARFQSEITSMSGKLEKLQGAERIKEQQRLQMELQKIAAKLQEEAMSRVMKDVESIAKSKGYDYIIDKKSMVAGGKDVTGEILSSLKGGDKPEEETPLLPMIPVK